MAKQEVEIYFKVQGLDGYITDLGDLQKALNDVQKQTEETSAATDSIGEGNKAGGFFNTIKTKGVGAFKALRGAIAATGIGLLITAFAQLVEWFKESDTGAKILKGTTAALGAVFDKIVELVTPLGEKIKGLFTDPKQALIDFGTAIKDNLISRFEGILNLIPNLSKAIGELFKGNFKEAGKIAFDAVAQVTTGVEGASDKIADFGEAAAEVFSEVVKDVQTAITASNNLIDAQNRLRKTQQDLLVENAKLNQELETQQKIADDTTRSYEERKAALDRVNAANEQLADNAVRLAQEEKAALELALQVANTDEERREIKDQLAEAEANLIDAETAAQIVRLESAQLNRELDQEELDRLEELRQEKADADAEEAERKAKVREKELAEIKAQNDAIIAAEEALQNAKFNAAQQGIAALSALAGDNEKAQNALFVVDKALAVGKVIIDSVKAKAANLAYAASLGPAGPAYLATANQAVNLNTAASLATIAATTIAKFKNGANTETAGGDNPGAPNPAASINYNFGQQAGGTIQPGQASAGIPIQTYVLASDVTNAQQAQQQIQNLAKL